MFARKYTSDAPRQLQGHHAVMFNTEMKQTDVVKLLKKMGVAKFTQPDKGGLGGYDSTPVYKDDRIVGRPSYQNGAVCCSFTKNSTQWYLFPIHRDQLANTGLTEDDLIYWIKFLNDMKVGFKYLYLGEQEGNKHMSDIWKPGRDNGHMVTSNTYYWVVVPKFAAQASFRKAYLHWVALRYLINTTISSDGSSYGTTRPYYILPRVAVMLHEDLGLSKLRAFLYAHLSFAYKEYYSLCHSDTMYNTAANRKPDVSVSPTEFRKLWAINGPLNAMLACYVTDRADPYNGGADAVKIKKFAATYNTNVLFDLAAKNDWKGFVQHIEKSYRALRTKKTKDGKKETVNS
jgi:hypothetical protein